MGLAYPWLLVLAPLPVLAWVLLPPNRERGAVRVPASVLAFLSHQSAASSRVDAARPLGLLPRIIGWIALIIALAGPFATKPAVLKPTGRDIIVAFDLSASMAEEDMVTGTRRTSRIDVVRDSLGAFIRGRKGDRVALVAFATEAFLIAPLTFDVSAVAEMLDEVSIGLPGRKTDLGQAIGLTVKLLRDEAQGERLMILVSDGEANAGQLAASEAAALARDLGIRIFSIGFAGEIEAENAAHLSELAQMTGGGFHSATDPGLMNQALARVEALAPNTGEQNASERRQDLRWPLLVVALMCLLVIGWQEHREP